MRPEGAKMTETGKAPEFDESLLDLLRCPVGVHDKSKGEDPGRLRLVRGCWLVCDETGLKYPIREGIPIMLVDVGERFRDVEEGDLPVPPPEV
jgi:uncharacterized protein YbaR (Trm112 family)